MASVDSDFYPGRLGELLNGRYRILRKLGEGAHSSVFLVIDEYARGRDKETTTQPSSAYFAVKILTADVTQRHSAGQTREGYFLQSIATQSSEIWGLSILCDHFQIAGSHGPHLCFVMYLLGSSLSDLTRMAPGKALPVYLVRNIIIQLVDAVAQLHSLGVIHTDIKPGNILINSINTDEEVARWLEHNPPRYDGDFELPSRDEGPDISSLTLDEGKVRNSLLLPQPLPLPLSWDCTPEKAELLSVTLVDFGKAQAVGEQPTLEDFAPIGLRSPEEILNSYFGPKIDIWAIGCLTFEFLTGRWMFHPEGGATWSLDEDHLAKMLEVTGDEFNDTMLRFSLRRDEFFDEEGKLINIPELIPIKLEQAISVYKQVPEDEVGPAADFIRACLRLDPLQRPSAADLEKHSWLQTAFSC